MSGTGPVRLTDVAAMRQRQQTPEGAYTNAGSANFCKESAMSAGRSTAFDIRSRLALTPLQQCHSAGKMSSARRCLFSGDEGTYAGQVRIKGGDQLNYSLSHQAYNNRRGSSAEDSLYDLFGREEDGDLSVSLTNLLNIKDFQSFDQHQDDQFIVMDRSPGRRLTLGDDCHGNLPSLQHHQPTDSLDADDHSLPTRFSYDPLSGAGSDLTAANPGEMLRQSPGGSGSFAPLQHAASGGYELLERSNPLGCINVGSPQPNGETGFLPLQASAGGFVSLARGRTGVVAGPPGRGMQPLGSMVDGHYLHAASRELLAEQWSFQDAFGSSLPAPIGASLPAGSAASKALLSGQRPLLNLPPLQIPDFEPVTPRYPNDVSGALGAEGLLETPLGTPSLSPSPPRSPDSSPNGSQVTNSLYKTELCRSWEETGSCRYGAKCQFAHGREELRPVARHPKYKTEICRTFNTNGTCPYGKRCRFIHQTVKSPDGATSGTPVKAPDTPKAVGASQDSVRLLGAATCSPRRLPIFQKIAPAKASLSA